MLTRIFAIVMTITTAIALALASVANAATVQGSLRYDGLPVTSTFTSMHSGYAGAYNWTTSQWTQGTVNLSTNSYSIPGLSTGQYNIQVRLSPNTSISDNLQRGGDLLGGISSLTISTSGTVTQNLDLSSAIRITQPLDGNALWQGSATQCPLGPAVAPTFTLVWDPVPLAASYNVNVYRRSCTALLAGDQQTVTTPSAQITQLVAQGEEYIDVSVDAQDAAHNQLSVMPFIDYLDGYSANAAFLHAATTPGGRPIHPTNSRFLAQVAHLAGQPPTFWKTDLYLSNPTTAPVTATLRFTPRDGDGTQNYAETTVNLPAGSSRTITDVLSLFPATGAGSLEVEPAVIEVSCRSYTPGTAGVAFGQGLVPIAADQTAWVGGPTQRLGTGGVSKGAFRANLALTEVWGEGVDLNVSLLDRNGTVVGQKPFSLLAFGNTQINDVVGKLGGPASIDEAQVVVEVISGGGRVGAVLSLTDNGSQDPLTVPLWRR